MGATSYSWLGGGHPSKDALKLKARSLSPDPLFDDEAMWKKSHWNLKETTRAGKMYRDVRGGALGRKWWEEILGRDRQAGGGKK